MKNRITALLALLCLAIAVAPNTPSASADYYDPEAQMWHDFAHDKGVEINLLFSRSYARIHYKAEYAVRAIEPYCEIMCRNHEEEMRYERIRKSIARTVKFQIGKCVWEAQMELDACYTDARAQLEAAGYDYFLPYVYNPYRSVQSDLVAIQRRANHLLTCASDCNIDSMFP